MTHLIKVEPADLTRTDIRWLVEATLVMYDECQAWEIVQWAVNGTLTIWRPEGGGEGFIVTSVEMDGTVLMLVALAGKNLVPHKYDLMAEFQRIAREAGAKYIRGDVVRKGLAYLYTKCLAMPVIATVHQIEVRYG